MWATLSFKNIYTPFLASSLLDLLKVYQVFLYDFSYHVKAHYYNLLVLLQNVALLVVENDFIFNN